jgi:predicted lipoprotein
MKMNQTIIRKNLIFGLALLLLLSCSDFTNQKKESALPVTKGAGPEVLGKNRFPEGFDPNAGEFSEVKMIANVGLNIIAPVTKMMRIQTEILVGEIDMVVARLREGSSADKELAAAQESWRKVMLNYHFLEGVPVGPLSDRQLGLKGRIYSWSSLCGVDKEVVKHSTDPRAPFPELITLKGLLAVEYLLFELNLGTDCNATNPENTKVVAWTKKSNPEKLSDRMKYASLLAKDLVLRMAELESRWSEGGFNYSKSMVDGTLYPNVKDATAALSDALFSIETLKDRRLAKPLGLLKDCLSEAQKCPEDVEHIWSGLSYDAIDAQVSGFEAAFFGRSAAVDGFGFDDFLKSLGHADVAEHFQLIVNAIHDQIRSLKNQGTLEAAVLALDPAQCKLTTTQNKIVPVCALFQEVRQLHLKLKSEFLSALSLRAPPAHQGDSD